MACRWPKGNRRRCTCRSLEVPEPSRDPYPILHPQNICCIPLPQRKESKIFSCALKKRLGMCGRLRHHCSRSQGSYSIYVHGSPHGHRPTKLSAIKPVRAREHARRRGQRSAPHRRHRQWRRRSTWTPSTSGSTTATATSSASSSQVRCSTQTTTSLDFLDDT